MKIAIIGVVINCTTTALELCKYHNNILLFEKKTLMPQTSSALSNLLDEDLHYLENFEFKLIKNSKDKSKALRECIVQENKNLISIFGDMNSIACQFALNIIRKL